MNRNWIRSSAVLSLGLLLGYGVPSTSPDPTPSPEASTAPQAIKIAIVDLQRVLSQSPRTKSRRDAHQKWVDENQSALTKAEDELQKLQEDLAIYQRDTPAFQEKSDALEMEKFRLQMNFKRLEDERERRAVTNHQENFAEIVTIIDGYAKEKGFNLVLQQDRSPVRGVTQDQVLLQMFSRSVLWADDPLDITDEVLTILGQ